LREACCFEHEHEEDEQEPPAGRAPPTGFAMDAHEKDEEGRAAKEREARLQEEEGRAAKEREPRLHEEAKETYGEGKAVEAPVEVLAAQAEPSQQEAKIGEKLEEKASFVDAAVEHLPKTPSAGAQAPSPPVPSASTPRSEQPDPIPSPRQTQSASQSTAEAFPPSTPAPEFLALLKDAVRGAMNDSRAEYQAEGKRKRKRESRAPGGAFSASLLSSSADEAYLLRPLWQALRSNALHRPFSSRSSRRRVRLRRFVSPLHFPFANLG
jgi:hypothetical protein